MTSKSRGHCDNIKVFNQGKSNQIREKSGKNQGIWLLKMCGHPGFRITKIVPFWYPRWPPWQPYWNSSNDISSQTVSWIEQKLDGKHWSDIQIQNCLNPFIWLFGHLGDRLKNLETTSAPNPSVRLSHNLVGGIGATWRLRLLKSFCSYIQNRSHVSHLENFQTTPPPAILKVFSCYLLPNSKLDWVEMVEGIRAS